jgi:hypothetical protein
VLTGLRDTLLNQLSHRQFYEYQQVPSDAVIDSIINNKGLEFYIEFSRQSGKTELIAKTVFALAVWYPLLTGNNLRVGVFAPKYDQSQITFKRLREAFEGSLAGIKDGRYTFSTFSSDTISLTNEYGQKTEIQCLTASKDTTIKGYTFDLIICEEAQDIDDTKIKEDILPMGAATNATRVFIGTPALGTHYRYFYNGVLRNHNCFIIDYKIAIKHNPNYAHYIEEQKELIDEDSPEFRSQYELVWILEASKFIDPMRLNSLGKPYNRIKEKPEGYIIAGLDVAKSPDSTVLTLVELDNGQKRVLDWLELHGENYEDQVGIITEYLSHYKVQKVVVDSVGVGDPIVDLLQRKVRMTVDGFKWTPQSHHDAFKTLWLEMGNGRLEYPATDEAKKTLEYKHFIQQFSDLNKEYRGNLMKCHHPDGKGFHDDFCSSLALAVQALTPTKPLAFAFGTSIKKEEKPHAH